MGRDVDERKKRAALRKLRKAAALAEQGLGPPLSDWEKQFLEEVEERIETYGSAFADPLRKTLKLRSRALRQFIASFSGGKVPPIRSYRSLIFIDEFGEYIEKMEKAFTPVPYQNWNIHCYPPPILLT